MVRARTGEGGDGPAGIRFIPHDKDGVPHPDGMQERALLDVARSAIRGNLRKAHAQVPPADGQLEPAPLFVTLWSRDGELRGCVGHVEARCRTLEEEVAECAVGAAFGDPRFPPLDAEEFDGMDVDITLLGHLQRVSSVEELDPTRWGVLVRGAFGRRGVLLPNVEGVDTAEEQVAIARRKAGLGPDEKVELYRYAVCKFGSGKGHA